MEKSKLNWSYPVMNDYIDAIADDVVSVSAIICITILGLNGVTDTSIIASIAGLGGYRYLKSIIRDVKKPKNND